MNDKDLIEWKTAAWRDPNMVSWYAERMSENKGSNRLKNAVETSLCAKFAAGKEILDVGIGTGRASLPLLDRGFRLTGIDSSQAMLDECARQAGNRPVTLKQGDVAALPLPDHSFDTLLSLNVMTHFPHWREVLSEWRRVVRPGGRIVFDVYCLEHLSFVEGRKVNLQELLARGAQSFNMHLEAEEIIDHADANGMRVKAIVPYGVIFSSRHRRFNAAMPLDDCHWWRRHLEWLAVDGAFLDLCRFIELEMFSRLPPRFSGRFMVVLDNEAGRGENDAWRRRRAELEASFAGAGNVAAALACTERPFAQWQAEFARHLEPMRNRVFAYLLLTATFGAPDAADFSSLVPTPLADEWRRWLKLEIADWRVARLIRRLRDVESLRCGGELLGGLNIGGRAEYELTRARITGNANWGMAVKS